MEEIKIMEASTKAVSPEDERIERVKAIATIVVTAAVNIIFCGCRSSSQRSTYHYKFYRNLLVLVEEPEHYKPSSANAVCFG